MIKQTALINDIQHFSLHDGPGIRTTVFFKGCPLNCRWCHNPEAISGRRELMFYSQFCTLCGRCVEVCPQECFSIRNNKLNLNRENCDNCGKCIPTCSADALELKGTAMSTDEILSECLVDHNYYKEEGGVTLSGGEPLIQGEFIFELMKGLKTKNINIVLDTCGFVPYERIERSLQWTDLYYYDLKCISRETHLEWTGVDNTLILDNLSKLLNTDADITARIPVIPGFNADDNEIKLIAEFLLPYKEKITAHLLPYHNLGSNKYSSLGLPYKMGDAESPPKKEMEKYAMILNNTGIRTLLFSK
ncbi:MAG: glycyl-radical enzyme activating protein [Spirochaetales bacterium]|uniref:Glycyl-radical enzyme activating protein n=1 Tax=Candidatus Thalassospirochaeta sargassi TaxID=3119039 RepID=A0AAJ1MNZ4_9SPIO|nr:glycyl-radical enzyme activating protein [Spirochaetales bacterium]